jgi:hypothetical protein
MIQMRLHIHLRMPDGMEVRQEGFTLTLDAHGCLLAMETKPEVGQPMYLVNPKSGTKQSGRVIRAQRSRDGGYVVAFAFDRPAPQPW